MSVYDLYQSYLNQMQSPVVQEEDEVDPNYLLYLQQQQQMQGGGDGGSTFSPNLAVGQQPPSALLTGIMSVIAPPIGLAMGAQRLADKGMLPGPLNSLFASRASGNVEMGLPQVINMQSLFNDFGPSPSIGPGGVNIDALTDDFGFSGNQNNGPGGDNDGGGLGPSDPGGSDTMGSF